MDPTNDHLVGSNLGHLHTKLRRTVLASSLTSMFEFLTVHNGQERAPIHLTPPCWMCSMSHWAATSSAHISLPTSQSWLITAFISICLITGRLSSLGVYHFHFLSCIFSVLSFIIFSKTEFAQALMRV